MSLSADQRGVLRGIAAALAITAIALPVAAFTGLFPRPAGGSMADRLGFAASWSLLLILWLIVSIGTLARHRFFTPEDMDGGGLTRGTARAKTLQASLQNTLEQVVLAGFVYGFAAVLLPLPWLPVIPAAAILFLIGRILFMRGYERGAVGRALGFGLTFYPSVLLFLIVVAGTLF